MTTTRPALTLLKGALFGLATVALTLPAFAVVQHFRGDSPSDASRGGSQPPAVTSPVSESTATPSPDESGDPVTPTASPAPSSAPSRAPTPSAPPTTSRPARAQVSGTITDARGHAVSGAKIALFSSEDTTTPVQTVTSDASGHYRFQGVGAGVHLLRWKHDGRTGWSGQFEVGSKQKVSHDLVVEATTGTLAGTVLLPEGTDATVTVDVNATVTGEVVASFTLTDRRFRVDDLPPGTYRVTVRIGDGDPVRSAPVDVLAGGTATIEVDATGAGPGSGSGAGSGTGDLAPPTAP